MFQRSDHAFRPMPFRVRERMVAGRNGSNQMQGSCCHSSKLHSRYVRIAMELTVRHACGDPQLRRNRNARRAPVRRPHVRERDFGRRIEQSAQRALQFSRAGSHARIQYGMLLCRNGRKLRIRRVCGSFQCRAPPPPAACARTEPRGSPPMELHEKSATTEVVALYLWSLGGSNP